MSVANGSHCQATMMMIENSGNCANQSTGCRPNARASSANTPQLGFMISCFQITAATGGITKKGEITRMRTIPWPQIGWSRRSARRVPSSTVIRRTPMTMISVLAIDCQKAGSV
jgi:hypothetical protein